MPIRGRYSPFNLIAFNRRLDHGLLLGLTGQAAGGGADDHGLGTKDSPQFTGATLSSLTATRVLFAGASGVISDDAGFTFASGVLTAGTYNATDEDNVLQIDGTTILRTGTAANKNVFIGEDTATVDEGTNNIFIGFNAGKNNDGSQSERGLDNVFIGSEAGAGNSIGGRNVYIGTQAGFGSSPADRNVGIGFQALQNNRLGGNNFALGFRSLRNNDEGSNNIGIGSFTLNANLDQSNNIAIGADSLSASTGGKDNTSIGKGSGLRVTSGDENLFLGYFAGAHQTTNSNLLIIDNQDRGSAALELTNCLIYGIFDATPASQSLRFNLGTLALGNPTHSDADGSGAIQLQFIREQSGGEASIAGQIEVSHDGTGDDQLGKEVHSVNTGAGLAEAMRLDSNLAASFTKIKLTELGGYAVKLTNKTGSNSVAGQAVRVDNDAVTGTDDAVILTATDEYETIGVFLDSGIADGSEAWVVTFGIADVAMEDNTAATRGNWVRTSVTEAGYADATNAAPPGGGIPEIDQHLHEIGHCIESVAAGGDGTHILARCLIHFN